jgi:hypothetical protein
MNGIIKFMVGAIAIALLATASHIWLGRGASFIDGLESNARSALGNAGSGGQIGLTFVREPALERVAVLSGAADAAMRARMITAVRAVPGVRDVRWADVAAAPAPEMGGQ